MSVYVKKMNLSQPEIAAIVTGVCLIVSEFLPFFSVVEGNGLVQIVAKVILRLSAAQKNTTPTLPPNTPLQQTRRL
jgi:hypothetical protein